MCLNDILTLYSPAFTALVLQSNNDVSRIWLNLPNMCYPFCISLYGMFLTLLPAGYCAMLIGVLAANFRISLGEFCVLNI